jgi:hypothetical protein
MMDFLFISYFLIGSSFLCLFLAGMIPLELLSLLQKFILL